MFNLPDTYREDVNVSLRDFIPKDMKPNDKKRVKDAVKSVKLAYQIAGEEIPSVIDEDYRCQVIQLYDIEVTNIKETNFLASIYQSLIKPLCVIHMYDTRNEVYSLAVKRLNQVDNMQVVIEQNLLTDKYVVDIPDSGRDKFLAYMDYAQIKNKTDKVNLYKEWFYKAYLLNYEKAYTHTDSILDGNAWYDSKHVELLYTYFKKLVDTRTLIKKAVTGAERINLNKEIKNAIQQLNNANNIEV